MIDTSMEILIFLTLFVWVLILFVLGAVEKRKRARNEAWRRDSLRRWN
jgi:uncharacterized membrane protein YsdA (DUF1294 family)